MGVTKEQLQDGRILTYLIQEFIKQPKKEALIKVFRCLRDSNVWVPMDILLSKEEEEQWTQAIKGEQVVTKDAVPLKPKIVKGADGSSYLLVFSRKEEIPKQFQEQYTSAHIPFMDCIQIVKRISDIDEIVLNGYTNGKSIKLDQEYLGVIEQLPSELVEERAEQTPQ